jgi:hypothetical protein
MKNSLTLANDFYNAFQNKDYWTMQQAYATNSSFEDPVFGELNAEQTKKMWKMLIKNGNDLELKYEILESDHHKVKVRWIAKYTFSRSKRLVINEIFSTLIFENEKIILHTDQFDFYKWARQAFGFSGLLLGWTKFFKNKTREGALISLNKFIET